MALCTWPSRCVQMNEGEATNKDALLMSAPGPAGGACVPCRGRNRLLCALVCTACIGGLLFGFDTGVISGAMLQIRAPSAAYGGIAAAGLSDLQQEVIVSAAIAGAILGAALCGWAADRFGRRPVLLVAASLFTLGALLMAAAGEFAVLVVGRVLGDEPARLPFHLEP